VDEGIRLGVVVTPAFYIHNRLIVGSFFHIQSNPLVLAQASHKIIIAVKDFVC
jgi:hypothetical protein